MIDFSDVKRRNRSGEAIKRIREAVGYNLGTWKKTRLKRAGAGDSGTLLHDEVAAAHAEKMALEFEKRLVPIGLTSRQRLKFLTVLHSCEEMEGAPSYTTP